MGLGGAMLRHFRANLLCCAAISIFLMGGQSKRAGGGSDAALLARRVAGLESRQIPLVSTFENALSLAQVPGGLVIVKGCDNAPGAVVTVSGDTLASVLRSVQRADPSYLWTIEDGVLDLLPKRSIPPLLGVKIRTFDVRGAANPSDAANVLFGLPEFREGVARLGLVQGGVQSFLGSGEGESATPKRERSTFHLHVEDVNVLSALNAIVRANDRGVWIYNQRSCHGQSVFNIGFSQ
jgi:hypothetical protein